MHRTIVVLAVVAALVSVPGCNRGKETTTAKQEAAPKGKPSYAFINNGPADFWKHATVGANKAGTDLNVDVTVITPTSGTDQTRKLEDLITRGVDGVAISPIDPDNQIDTINKAAAQSILITHDSDAPQTNRLVYIGMDNYSAGVLCGKTLREAMPDGGKVMIFVGRMDQDNGKRRRAGFIDALLSFKQDPNHNYPPGQELVSDDKKFIVLGTMTDQFDKAKAKANVEDAVTRTPDIAGMVGLFGYNPPMILEGLERIGKLGKIKVMAFDEDDGTLQGVKDGNIVATVVQNPYQYGYQSITVLNELHKGNKKVIPENKFIDIPARLIDKSTVDAFWKEVNERLGKK